MPGHSLGSIFSPRIRGAAAAFVAIVLPLTAYPAQVALTWADNSINETGFRIERATGTGSFAQIATTGTNIAAYADSSVTAGSSYRYRVRAYNGASSSAYSNSVTVNVPAAVPANTAPTISNLVNRTISMNGTTGAIAFTVGDSQTAAGSLAVSGSSSNTTLVPVSGITFGGSGANRTVTVRPAANRTGTATITVRVSDGSLLASDTFVLTVNSTSAGGGGWSGWGGSRWGRYSSNSAPTVSSLASQSVVVNGSTETLAFTVADAETAPDSLVVTASSSDPGLIPDHNITVGGSGTERTLEVRPVSNRTGAAVVEVAVSDGENTTTTRMQVNVGADLQFIDVGDPAIRGGLARAEAEIMVTAAGARTWSITDQLGFAQMSVTGDSEITVQLSTLAAVSPESRAGLMYRASSAYNAAHVAVYLTASSRLVLESRAATGAARRSVAPLAGRLPQWLRLTRTGDSVYAFASVDGVQWDLVEFATVDLPDTALAGVVVSSQVGDRTAVATFRDFTVD
jgi:hypothetical protein